jgi:hypothetical protein
VLRAEDVSIADACASTMRPDANPQFKILDQDAL